VISSEGLPVSLEREIDCEDFGRRLDGFLDGELDAASLRSMALHATHCRPCGEELDRSEKLSASIVRAVEDEVAKIDAAPLWNRIAAELPATPPSRMARVRESLRAIRWASPLPVLAASGLAATLAALFLFRAQAEPVDPEIVADNQAQIERIASSAEHVAVWSEPTAHTTAIWVASYDEGPP